MSESVPTREGELLAGKYQLRKCIGRGGMGEVYLAENTLIERIVAIKVLYPQFAAEEQIVGRFLREARAANIVRHPNVVDVLDIGQDDAGAPFIVQEYLEGQDLGQVIAELAGSLPTAAALEWMLPVVDAIAVAHAKGVVHRDLKPSNVFLAQVGDKLVPKVLDFGIAKVDDPKAVRMTGAGTRMGTPAYMAPEVIRLGAQAADARSDIWSLGVMLYEVLAGVLPFETEPSSALFVRICTEDPLPLEVTAPHIPEEVARILSTCLAKSPDDRYAHAAELADDLRITMEGLRSTVPHDMRMDIGLLVRQAADRASLRPRTIPSTVPDLELDAGAASDPAARINLPTPVFLNDPSAPPLSNAERITLDAPAPIAQAAPRVRDDRPVHAPEPPPRIVPARPPARALESSPPASRANDILHWIALLLLSSGSCIAEWAGADGLRAFVRDTGTNGPLWLGVGAAGVVILGLGVVVQMTTSGAAKAGAPLAGTGALGYAVVLGTLAVQASGVEGLPDLSGNPAHLALTAVGLGIALTCLGKGYDVWGTRGDRVLGGMYLAVGGVGGLLALLAAAAVIGLR